MTNYDKIGLLPVGTLLNSGNYRIEKHLASGGFGNTYVATHIGLDERVAIKELFLKGICNRSDADGSITITIAENRRLYDSQLAKFKKEALRLRKLNNRHIVRVLNYFEENGTAYYVMDFLKGESLSARMKRTHRPLTEQEVLHFLPQVLDALAESHAANIWHLDLKPGNIMVNDKGEAVLIDFGASKQVSNTDTEGATTSTANCYTPGYAPSELTEGAIEKFGPHTDMYSLGATIYALLTHLSPPSPSVVMEDGLPPYAVPVSDAMQRLVKWMMQYARNARPQNVEAVRKYLKENFGEVAPPEPVVIPEEPEEVTVVEVEVSRENPQQNAKKEEEISVHVDDEPAPKKKWKWVVAGIVAVAAISGIVATNFGKEDAKTSGGETVALADSVEVDKVRVAVKSQFSQDSIVYSYTGKMVNGLPQGRGRAVQEDGHVYEGLFVDGLYEDDNGTMYMKNGDKYVGTFRSCYFHGPGAYYFQSNGNSYKGKFVKGQPSPGTVVYDSGGKVINKF